jgi:hypothetical protein
MAYHWALNRVSAGTTSVSVPFLHSSLRRAVYIDVGLKLGAADKNLSQLDNLAAGRTVIHIRSTPLFLRDCTA